VLATDVITRIEWGENIPAQVAQHSKITVTTLCAAILQRQTMVTLGRNIITLTFAP